MYGDPPLLFVKGLCMTNLAVFTENRSGGSVSAFQCVNTKTRYKELLRQDLWVVTHLSVAFTALKTISPSCDIYEVLRHRR